MHHVWSRRGNSPSLPGPRPRKPRGEPRTTPPAPGAGDDSTTLGQLFTNPQQHKEMLYKRWTLREKKRNTRVRQLSRPRPRSKELLLQRQNLCIYIYKEGRKTGGGRDRRQEERMGTILSPL